MEEMIFNLADTHLFFNDLEVSDIIYYTFVFDLLSFLYKQEKPPWPSGIVPTDSLPLFLSLSECF